MNHIEVEIKSLLGEESVANELRERIVKLPYSATLKGKSTQLNHYFIDGDLQMLLETIGKFYDEENQKKLDHIITEGKNHSVRTRSFHDGKSLLVVKASIDDTTSSNGLARIEFEEALSGFTIEKLDQILLNAGLRYQAKWSRDREEYVLADGTNVSLDKNAGYGYLAEFERVVERSDEVEGAKQQIRNLMTALGAEELPQDRLERMFQFYNEHWQEYYGTGKVFSIK